MKTYYIYHIPGVKIGCSNNPKARVKRQGYSQFEILEEHSDIMIASEREIELQKQYGYGKDTWIPYWKTVNAPTPNSRIKAGQITGQLHVKSGHWRNINSIGGKIGGPKGGKIMGNRELTCPYCKTTTKGIGYNRWHGNNCRYRP